jgi:PAS domain S-box-containing protein
MSRPPDGMARPRTAQIRAQERREVRMNGESFAHKMEAMQERVALLRRRADESPLPQYDLLMQALESLQSTLEELTVAEEESRQQNEELAAAREAVEAERQRYQELFEFAPDGYLMTDAEGIIREANRAAVTLLHTPRRFLVGKPLLLFVAKEESRAFHSLLIQVCRAKRRMPEWEVRLRPRHEAPFDAALTVAAVHSPEGKPVALCWLLRDVTERKQAQATQRHLTTLLEHEREIVRALTENFLGKLPQFPSLEVAARYEPAARAARVGGDYFDFIPLEPRRLGVVIGDVCGKGLTAAVYTAMAKYTLRAYALEETDPQQVLTRVNQTLYNEIIEEGMFVTLVYGILDLGAGSLTYANGGHPPPVLYDPATRRCQPLEVTGGIVGGVPRWTYQQRVVSLVPGAVLALFTDGLTEAARGESPRDDSVSVLLQEHATAPVEAIVQALVGRAHDLAGGCLEDDLAVVVIRRR